MPATPPPEEGLRGVSPIVAGGRDPEWPIRMEAGRRHEQVLLEPAWGTLSGRTSGATALNDAGWVVGYSSVPPNDWHHAALWAHAEGFDLGALGGSYAYAQDINNDGTVVGYSQTSAGRAHGFVWSAATGMLDLNDLVDPGVGEIQYAWSVNASGQIACSMRIPGQRAHCVILTPRR